MGNYFKEVVFLAFLLVLAIPIHSIGIVNIPDLKEKYNGVDTLFVLAELGSTKATFNMGIQNIDSKSHNADIKLTNAVIQETNTDHSVIQIPANTIRRQVLINVPIPNTAQIGDLIPFSYVITDSEIFQGEGGFSPQMTKTFTKTVYVKIVDQTNNENKEENTTNSSLGDTNDQTGGYNVGVNIKQPSSSGSSGSHHSSGSHSSSSSSGSSSVTKVTDTNNNTKITTNKEVRTNKKTEETQKQAKLEDQKTEETPENTKNEVKQEAIVPTKFKNNEVLYSILGFLGFLVISGVASFMILKKKKVTKAMPILALFLLVLTNVHAVSEFSPSLEIIDATVNGIPLMMFLIFASIFLVLFFFSLFPKRERLSGRQITFGLLSGIWGLLLGIGVMAYGLFLPAGTTTTTDTLQEISGNTTTIQTNSTETLGYVKFIISGFDYSFLIGILLFLLSLYIFFNNIILMLPR